MNSFPSSLSEPITTADSEEEARTERRGRETPALWFPSTAACADWADKDKSVLHVQESLAQTGAYCLSAHQSLYLYRIRNRLSNQTKQRPDSTGNSVLLLLEKTGTPAFHNSLLVLDLVSKKVV
jgi:hypothetical protein